jgi:hypothetical protein
MRRVLRKGQRRDRAGEGGAGEEDEGSGVNCLLCYRVIEPGYGAVVEFVGSASLVEGARVCARCANRLRREGVVTVGLDDQLLEVRLVELRVSP